MSHSYTYCSRQCIYFGNVALGCWCVCIFFRVSFFLQQVDSMCIAYAYINIGPLYGKTDGGVDWISNRLIWLCYSWLHTHTHFMFPLMLLFLLLLILLVVILRIQPFFLLQISSARFINTYRLNIRTPIETYIRLRTKSVDSVSSNQYSLLEHIGITILVFEVNTSWSTSI